MRVSAAVLLIVIFGCTEPADHSGFEGVITSRATVKDVFTGKEDVFIGVGPHQDVAVMPGCDRASVDVTSSTRISFSYSNSSATSADLTVGKLVRVTPPAGPKDDCPRSIVATSVTITGSSMASRVAPRE